MGDFELIQHIQHGEIQFLTPLIERHYESICKYSYWKTGSTEAAQDITQETFYRFFRNFQNYTHCDKFRAYLYTIARHLCNDYFQEKQTLSLEEVDDLTYIETISMEDTIESDQCLYQLLEDLPLEQQEVIILRFSYDLKFREIAEITGNNICTVQYRIKKGLVSLKKKLEKEGYNEETNDRAAPKKVENVPYTEF